MVKVIYLAKLDSKLKRLETEMIIKCPKCGIEYSYGRNICHICEDHFIFFGAFFKGNRQEYQWNCDTKILSTDSKYSHFKSKDKMDLENVELIMEQKRSYEWNCDPVLRVMHNSLHDKKLVYSFIYE